MDQREALKWVEAVQKNRFEGSEVSMKATQRVCPAASMRPLPRLLIAWVA